MESWEKLNKIVEGHSDSSMLSEIQRDGHCHEAVMWYVHHVTEDMKEILSSTTDITIPLFESILARENLRRCVGKIRER